MGIFESIIDYGTTSIGLELGKKAIGIDFGNRERKLTPQELKIGMQVFKNTIKWRQVRITNGHGQGNSVFTNAGIGQDTMHMTKTHYINPPNLLLVHELTHIWQATNHGITGWGYKLNSIAHQGYHRANNWKRSLQGKAKTGRTAYTYDPKKLGKDAWDDFGIEEQAEIVEDWFKNGQLRTDPAFRYIHWCIRKKAFIGAAGFICPPDVK